MNDERASRRLIEESIRAVERNGPLPTLGEMYTLATGEYNRRLREIQFDAASRELYGIGPVARPITRTIFIARAKEWDVPRKTRTAAGRPYRPRYENEAGAELQDVVEKFIRRATNLADAANESPDHPIYQIIDMCKNIEV